MQYLSVNGIQSALPIKGVTNNMPALADMTVISIHTPYKGSDQKKQLKTL